LSKSSDIWAYQPAPRRVRRRVESIYSKRSEEPKTACRRKPTAPGRSEFERCGAIRNKSRASDRSADLADRSNTAIFTKLSDD
jgi:hypothetical protein